MNSVCSCSAGQAPSQSAPGLGCAALAVVEDLPMESNELALSLCFCARDCLFGRVVCDVRWANTLSYFSSAIVGLQKEPARTLWARREPAMPNIGDEKSHIARLGRPNNFTPTFEAKRKVPNVFWWWDATCRVASGSDDRRAIIEANLF